MNKIKIHWSIDCFVFTNQQYKTWLALVQVAELHLRANLFLIVIFNLLDTWIPERQFNQKVNLIDNIVSGE